ncbi:hypothetical protein ACFKIX_000450 [Vibrio alginolyticus]
MQKSQRYLMKPSLIKLDTETGIKTAKACAMLSARLGPPGILIGGAVGFVAGAVIGGLLDDPLDYI